MTAAIFTSCSSTKVVQDYDKEVDFSAYSTYQMVIPENINMAGLTERRIVDAITNELAIREIAESEGTPDFWISFAINVDTKTSYHSSNNGYGGYGYRRRGGVGFSSSTTTEVQTNYGIITINVVDTQTNNVVWTSTQKKAISGKNQDENIPKVIASGFQGFPIEVKS